MFRLFTGGQGEPEFILLTLAMIMVSNCKHYKNDGAMEGLRQTNSPPDIACWVKGGWGEMEKYTGSDNSSFQLQQVWIGRGEDFSGMRILWQLCLLEVLVHNFPWFPVRWQWRWRSSSDEDHLAEFSGVQLRPSWDLKKRDLFLHQLWLSVMDFCTCTARWDRIGI